MRLLVNGVEFDVPNLGRLYIEAHVDDADENYGPCLIRIFGGTLTFQGDASQPAAVMVTRGDSLPKFGIEYIAGHTSPGLDISSGATAYVDALAAAEAKLKQLADADEPKPIKFREFL